MRISPAHEKANVPENPQKEWQQTFHSAPSLGFTFLRIQKRRDSRRAAETEEHQAEMKGENEMGDGQQKSRRDVRPRR